jgi:cytochrome c-type biogenesis protein CcmH/NrfG
MGSRFRSFRGIRVLARSPGDPLALYYLARLERSLGDGGAADAAWRRLVAANPAFADSALRRDGPP